MQLLIPAEDFSDCIRRRCSCLAVLFGICLAFVAPGCGPTTPPASQTNGPAKPSSGELALAPAPKTSSDNVLEGTTAGPNAEAIAIQGSGATEMRAPETVTDESKLAMLKANKGYIQSTGCRDCHAEQHASWHETFHRSMTQEATPETIRGRFDGQMISVAGYPCQPFREGDRFFVSLVHPAWEEQELAAGRDPRQHAQPPPMTYEVNRVIGSHHQQVYLSRAPDGAYHTLPIVWQIAEQRWITRKASFLLSHRDSFYHMTKLWNNGCVFCHNTGPEPGLQQSYVAGRHAVLLEHPGSRAGDRLRSLPRTWSAHTAEMQQTLAQSPISPADLAPGTAESPSAAGPSADEPIQSLIVNPAKLNKEQSVLTCARCHGKMIAKAEFDRQCLVEGDFFRPGQWDFVERYNYPTRDPQTEFAEMKDGMYFWADGTPRTTALEYQGVLQSACYQRGEMTCLSCHSMHNSPPNDQLRYGDDPGLELSLQNEACNQCHPQFKDPVQLKAHTHHAPASSGSLCYNCHMPYQSYSLLKRTRSHRISNPSPSHYRLKRACPTRAINVTLIKHCSGPTKR